MEKPGLDNACNDECKRTWYAMEEIGPWGESSDRGWKTKPASDACRRREACEGFAVCGVANIHGRRFRFKEDSTAGPEGGRGTGLSSQHPRAKPDDRSLGANRIGIERIQQSLRNEHYRRLHDGTSKKKPQAARIQSKRYS